MTFSYTIFLIPYGLFLLAFFVFAFINFYNLIKYSGFDFVGFLATFIFLAGIMAIIFFTYQGLSDFDWSQTVTVSIGENFLPKSF